MTQENKNAFYQTQYRKRHPNNVRNSRLKYRYGISLRDFLKKKSRQGGVCAICWKTNQHIYKPIGKIRGLSVDHCHQTGKVRGLLCSNCNRALGFFNDDPDLLKQALVYLELYEKEPK